MMIVDVENALEQARTGGEKKAMEKARKEESKRWERLAPMFRDYLSGMTVKEVSQKYDYQRNEFYRVLHRYGVPLVQAYAAAQTRRFANMKANDKRLAAMMRCKCLKCQWHRARLERHLKGEVDL